MKTGNVILAIFLWLCIPGSILVGFLLGLFVGVLGGVLGGGLVFAIGAPLLFFFLGLVALVTGMEKKPQPPYSQPVVVQQPIQPSSPSQQLTIQQPTNDTIRMKETIGVELKYNRNDLIFGIILIGIGIVVFFLTLWIEPFVVNGRVETGPVMLALRMIALISIVGGIIAIIAALIPKKEYFQIEQEKK